MGCFVALIARAGLIGVWIATPLVSKAFGGNWFFPLLGVLFLPITALVYIFVYSYSPGGGVEGWGWGLVGLAFLVDLAIHSVGAYTNRKRFARFST